MMFVAWFAGDGIRAGGYTFKSSRPNPYKGNPNLQASFKKTV